MNILGVKKCIYLVWVLCLATVIMKMMSREERTNKADSTAVDGHGLHAGLCANKPFHAVAHFKLTHPQEVRILSASSYRNGKTEVSRH